MLKYYNLYLMSYRCLPHSYLNLNICWGLFYLGLIFYCILYFPHIISVSTSCSSKDFIMFSLFLLVILLIDIVCFSHSLQVYIVVDTVLYLYALQIYYLLTLFSSYCLCYGTLNIFLFLLSIFFDLIFLFLILILIFFLTKKRHITAVT